jgi:hypothetical protein
MDSGNLALGLLSGLSFLFAGWVLVSHRDMKRMEVRLRDLEHAMSNQRHDMITLDTLDSELRTVSRNAEASNNLLGCVLAERIDAISARLDAVELETGLREKPKIMGGK